ncbi:ribonuclease H-like domain-containing protein [Tanacetum coccineum]
MHNSQQDVHSFFDAAVKNGSIHLYVAYKKQNLGKYYYKNMEWEEDDAGLRCCSSTPFDTRYKRKIRKSKKIGVIHDEGASRKRKKSLVNGGNKGKEKVFEDEGADKKQKETLVNEVMVNGKAKMVEVKGDVKTGRDRGVVIGGKEEVVKVKLGSQVAYLLIYVDDIILKASSLALLQQIIDSLHNEFDMTDLGALNYFFGIFADRNSTESKLRLDGVTVEDPTLYRSLAGGYSILHLHVQICLMSFSSIHTLSRSSAEAEYRGVANVVAETAWLRNLLRELHSPLSTATLVYCDNVSAVYMSANPVQHQRTKHIEIDIHFVRDMVTAGQVRVLHVPSRYQYADIFTKGLPSALFEEFRSSLSVHPPPAPTAGAY